MATNTYIPIASITLGSSASSVTFSSIPQTYQDLVLVINGKPNTGDTSIDLVFNSDTTNANYPATFARGNGSATGSGTLTSSGSQITYSASGGNLLIATSIMDYSATDKHKTLLTRTNGDGASDWVAMWAGRWADTSALNNIEVTFVQVRTWNTGTTLALYGIEA